MFILGLDAACLDATKARIGIRGSILAKAASGVWVMTG